MESIKGALALRQTAPGFFETTAHSDYCYGAWAWGGLLASLIQTAAAQHVSSSDKSHTDVTHLQLQFLRPVLKRPLSLAVSIIHKTKSATTVHVNLSQGGKSCVVGYVKLGDLTSSYGPTFDTHWKLHPQPRPVTIQELVNNASHDWIRYHMPYYKDGWYSLQSMVYFLLPKILDTPRISDQWLTPTDPRNKFTNDALGMLADLWAPFLENFFPGSAVNHSRLIEIAEQQNACPTGQSELSSALRVRGWSSPYIITTTSMTLDIKKRLPDEGVDWLFVRACTKSIDRGRFDVEVIILDEHMELVALSHQTGLAAEFRQERATGAKLLAKV